MASFSYCVLSFTVILSFYQCAASVCLQNDPCLCKLDEYSQISISNIAPSGKFIYDSEGNYTYFFSGCKDVKFAPSEYGLNSTQALTGSLIRCQAHLNVSTYEVKINGNKTANLTFATVTHTCETLGSSSQIRFNLASNAGSTYEIAFDLQNKSVSSPIIHLVCDKFNQTDLKIKNQASNELTLYSPHACVTYLPNHKLSNGSIFCILFFVMCFLYFVGGSLVMYFVRGARGLEIVPNFEFWASLPGLVKDGTIFLLSGCRPFTPSSAEAYDRI